MSARALAAIESGQASPSWRTVSSLLAAAGLEPSLERALPTPCAHLERYLRPLAVALRASALPDLALDALVLRTCASVPPGYVPVGIGYGGRLLVPPPEVLALDAACAAHRLALRAAARLLHEQEGRDDAERRAAAHRDPDERKEHDRLMEIKAYRDPQARPSTLASRAWRLDGPVSLRQWMRENRYPDVG